MHWPGNPEVYKEIELTQPVLDAMQVELILIAGSVHSQMHSQRYY